MAGSTVISLREAIVVSVPFKAKLVSHSYSQGLCNRPLTTVVRRRVGDGIEGRKRIVVMAT